MLKTLKFSLLVNKLLKNHIVAAEVRKNLKPIAIR
jgi:hypothetical protein